MDQPAEREGGAEADERRDLGNERTIRRGNAKPDDPVGAEVQREGERHASSTAAAPCGGAANDGVRDAHDAAVNRV